MNNMRTSLLILLVSLSLSTEATIRKQGVDSIVIKYASWNIITDIAIDCENYEKSIDYQMAINSDTSTIRQLFDELDKLNTTDKGGEDIRCKLEFYQAGSIVQSCCIGSIITKVDSTYYYTTSSLRSTIDAIIRNSQTKDNEGIYSWNPNLSSQKIVEYIRSQSERIYGDLILYDDLSFTVFCNVGEGGKTLSTRFTYNLKKSKEIPSHIISVIQKILTDEVIWDIPKNTHTQWVPVYLLIKSNAQSKD